MVIPYVVSGNSLVVSETTPSFVPKTAPDEAKTKVGGDDDDDDDDDDDLFFTEDKRFIVPRTFVCIASVGSVSQAPDMAAAR